MIELPLVKARFTIMIPKSESFKRGVRKILGKGAASSAVYQDPDNQNIIIKEAAPTPRNANGGYVRRQKRGAEIIKRIIKSGYDYGVVFPELLNTSGGNLHITNPNESVAHTKLSTFEHMNKLKRILDKNSPNGYIDLTPNQSISETMLPGIMLNNDDYFNLKDSTKNLLAKKLAQFLFTIHNLEKPCPATANDRRKDILFTSQIFPQTNKTIRPEIIQTKFTNFTNTFKNTALKKVLTSAVSVLWQEIGDDEIIVMTHGDLRWPNIIYDKTHNSIGVIDFENARIGHIYRDFVASSNSFHWDFVQRIVRHYNKIQKMFERPNRINTTKVKNFMICRTIDVAMLHAQKEINEDQSLDGKEISPEKLRDMLISKMETELLKKLPEYGLMEKPQKLSLYTKKQHGRN